eukprot:7391876-Prymnesium_polylepis.4
MWTRTQADRDVAREHGRGEGERGTDTSKPQTTPKTCDEVHVVTQPRGCGRGHRVTGTWHASTDVARERGRTHTSKPQTNHPQNVRRGAGGRMFCFVSPTGA